MEEKRPPNYNMNRKPRPYVTNEDENGGVYYSPSRSYEGGKPTGGPTPRREGYTPARPPKQTGGGRKLPPKKQKSQYAVFLITTVFVGIVICLIVFAVVFNSITSGRKDEYEATKPTETSSISSSIDDKEDDLPKENISNLEIGAIITDISKTSKNIMLYDIDNEKEYSVFVDNTTLLKDKYGSPIVFAEFKRGDIVQAQFGETDNLLISMQASTSAWKFTSSAKVDTVEKTIKISGATYSYNDNIIAVYKNGTFDIANIDPVDTVTVRGYKDTALYIELEKSHGTLTMEARTDIKNGTLEIDNEIYKTLNEPIEIKVTEGTHKIVIKGDNIEPYSKEIDVESEGVYDLDFPEIVIKAGAVTFKISEPDATLTINGKETSFNNPVELDYGEYDIKITKSGFVSWEKKITLDKPTYEVSATLEKAVQVSKLAITSEPSGANIYIDNIYVGISPLTTSVEYGLRTITVRKSGYIEISFSVDVNTESIPLPITLSPVRDDFPSEIPPSGDAVPTLPPDAANDVLY